MEVMISIPTKCTSKAHAAICKVGPQAARTARAGRPPGRTNVRYRRYCYLAVALWSIFQRLAGIWPSPVRPSETTNWVWKPLISMRREFMNLKNCKRTVEHFFNRSKDPGKEPSLARQSKERAHQLEAAACIQSYNKVLWREEHFEGTGRNRENQLSLPGRHACMQAGRQACHRTGMRASRQPCRHAGLHACRVAKQQTRQPAIQQENTPVLPADRTCRPGPPSRHVDGLLGPGHASVQASGKSKMSCGAYSSRSQHGAHAARSATGG